MGGVRRLLCLRAGRDGGGGGAARPTRRLIYGRRPRWQRRLLAVLAAILAIVLLLAAATTIYLLTLPSVGDAEARVEAILSAHGGRASTLPPPGRLAAAIVSTEDENFYANAFVNVASGVGRAAVAAIGTSEDPGGSTIPQQLAKTLYPHGAGVTGTLEEIGLGVKLSLAYSHEQVLSMYLNSIYYGNGYWGDVAAAHGYFGVSPRRLTWGEAAMLAGLPQAPSAYDPVLHLALAKTRQRHVLDQLVVNGHLTEAAADRAFREPLPLPGSPWTGDLRIFRRGLHHLQSLRWVPSPKGRRRPRARSGPPPADPSLP